MKGESRKSKRVCNLYRPSEFLKKDFIIKQQLKIFQEIYYHKPRKNARPIFRKMKKMSQEDFLRKWNYIFTKDRLGAYKQLINLIYSAHIVGPHLHSEETKLKNLERIRKSRKEVKYGHDIENKKSCNFELV